MRLPAAWIAICCLALTGTAASSPPEEPSSPERRIVFNVYDGSGTYGSPELWAQVEACLRSRAEAERQDDADELLASCRSALQAYEDDRTQTKAMTIGQAMLEACPDCKFALVTAELNVALPADTIAKARKAAELVLAGSRP